MRHLATWIAAAALLAAAPASAEGTACPDVTHLRQQVERLQHELQAARGPANPQGASQPFTIEGTVSSTAGDRLWVEDDQGNLFRITVPQDLQADADGQQVSVDQLQEGTPIRATARIVDGDQLAERIVVQPTPPPPGRPAGPGAGRSGAQSGRASKQERQP